MQQCNYCEYRTRFKSGLSLHVLKNHSEKIKHLSCKDCGRKFLKFASLNKHTSRMHSEEKKSKKRKAGNEELVIKKIRKLIDEESNISEIKSKINDVLKFNENNGESSKVDNRRKNSKVLTKNSEIKCDCCNVHVKIMDWCTHVSSQIHINKSSKVNDKSEAVVTVKKAFKNKITQYSYFNQDNQQNISLFLEGALTKVRELAVSSLFLHTAIQFQLCVVANAIKQQINDYILEEKNFNSKYFHLTKGSNFEDIYEEMCNIISNKATMFISEGSGWAFHNIKYMIININKYDPLNGAASYMELPKSISVKKACVNITNDDNFCFKWCLIAHFFKVTNNPNRPSSYPVDIMDEILSVSFENNKEVTLNFKNMNFPSTLKDVQIFEKQNPDISVNVFGIGQTGIDTSIVGPLYAAKQRRLYHVNLLLIEDDEDDDIRHFVLIRDLWRLTHTQFTKNTDKQYMCDYCLQIFTSEEKFTEHPLDCNKTITKLPNEGENILEYRNNSVQRPVPFVVYYDFETMLQKIESAEPDPEKSFTMTLHHHRPIAVQYIIVSTCRKKIIKDRVFIGRFKNNLFKNLNSNVFYFKFLGEDCSQKFVDNLIEDIKTIWNEYFKEMKPMILNKEDIQRQNTEKYCHLCEERLMLSNEGVVFDSNQIRVADHCHICGQYEGPAHAICNLQCKQVSFIPVVAHNSMHYDIHLFFKELAKYPGETRVIPKSMENYVSVSKFIPMNEYTNFELRFLDSFKFLSSSLSNLSNSLSPTDFNFIKNCTHDAFKLQLMTRKGVFPYTYIENIDKLYEKKLPNIENFYNDLTKEACSLEDYEHAKNVWSTFECQTIKDYLALYLMIDVYLLADIVENFRNVALKNYKICPLHFRTLPAFSFEAMKRFTRVKLELITDLQMFNMFKKSIRGGSCFCNYRHLKANNKYMADYNPKEPESYLMYWDANNLYGFAMCQKLPLGEYQWVDLENDKYFSKQMTGDDLMNIDSDGDYGYMLEVDLSIPRNLHDYMNDFPFFPQKRTVGNVQKLITSLYDKTNYILHIKNLQLALSCGVKLDNVHSVLRFRQSNWMAPYIRKNNELRTKAKTDFEKSLWKLFNNAVFGKTIEQVEKYREVKIISNWDSKGKRKGARAHLGSSLFHSVVIFDEELVGIELKKARIFYNKPIPVGCTILELSKVHMYHFHYKVIKERFPDCLLAYSDTDSTVYSIKGPDLYEDIKDIIPFYFDTSNYPVNNKYNIPLVNKKILGLFKDELDGKIMTEFVGLNPKTYAFLTEDFEEVKKAKGVKKCAMNEINFDHYRDCLTKKEIIFRKMIIFKSQLHNITSNIINKKALTYTDDKRLILEDGISTLAYGHYLIEDKIISDLEKNVLLDSDDDEVI